jgi:hypothetical protein
MIIFNPWRVDMNYNKLLKKDLIALLAKKESEVQALKNKVEELTLALQRNTGVMEQRPLIESNARQEVLTFVQKRDLLFRFQRAFGTKLYDTRISTNGAEWRRKGSTFDTPWNPITEDTFTGR